jgi:hypothetical protein
MQIGDMLRIKIGRRPPGGGGGILFDPFSKQAFKNAMPPHLYNTK